MPTSVHEVFEAFRAAGSNYERGSKFEKLMTQYLLLDPVYGRLFEQVWMWADWPGRGGKPDTGIDLVAAESDTGALWAIQCKFYEPDHVLGKPDVDSFLSASGKHPFAHRLIISTTDRWGKNAEDAVEGQQIPVQRIGLADIAEAPIDWAFAGPAERLDLELALAPKRDPWPHQREAIDKVIAGFGEHDRGKLIMACGTGKTFTALKVCEQVVDDLGGTAKVLFLVPSISLLSQTLREWTAQCRTDLRAFAVCSDTKVSRAVEDINPYDVPLPATTDPGTLVAQMEHRKRAKGLTVVFCTYQSINVIADAQTAGLADFDLVICDEAHRTTGVTLADGDDSNFVKVHDNSFLAATKRLYMTATPRLFAEETKAKAAEYSAVLASMDDEALYGPTFHRLGFGEAVERGLLTDYKVLVLTVDEKYIAGPLQQQLADVNSELNLDDATKIVGCWNGLAKRTGKAVGGADFGADTRPMQRAVAFLRDIKSSKKLAGKFATVIDAYDQADDQLLRCDVEHVDGTYNALERNHRLQWLKAPLADNQCRILANARCLSEGVDVPSLDAVLFLNPRSSVVDVVQSVGRVMRRAEGKQYGYIILPVGVPAGVAPSQALADNRRFKVVWQVLQALRAHDDRFNATVNKLELNNKATDSILVGHVPGAATENLTGAPTNGAAADEHAAGESAQVAEQLAMFTPDQWRDAVYAKIVDKVGTRTYWEDWAKDVAAIAVAQQTRIKALLSDATPDIATAFDKFVEALRANLNDSIDRDQAVEMLSQHLITKPVFDALFEGYDFAGHNPVSQVMQTMVATLHDQALESETERLAGFYESVRMRAAGIDNVEGKQRIVVELYEKFFRTGFPRTSKALGIVYTPTQVVDFILRAANDALQAEFGLTLTEPDVHILDPFTGTGTFIVRLIQTGLIRPEDLARKYAKELHANEIVLLAYYIAAINIEAAYHGAAGGNYQPFDGIVLTDTFQIAEAGDTMDADLFPQNNDRIITQQASPIRVIVGNPPYKSGQSSANDRNANQPYPTLDAAISATYAARSTAKLKSKLYDSYVRAIRWATDRIGDTGIVAYVTNSGWITGNTTAGIRLALPDEFSALYIYDLRGNQRQTDWRAEGGKIFDDGSQTGAAILIAVKNPSATGPCQIHYRNIGDRLSREDKLAIIANSHLPSMKWDLITPNTDGDWVDHRDAAFSAYTPLAVKRGSDETALFTDYSGGLKTNRDAWAYNFSASQLADNITATIDFYNEQVDSFQSAVAMNPELAVEDAVTYDDARISWSSGLLPKVQRGQRLAFHSSHHRTTMYRPFCKMHVYFDDDLNDRRGRLHHLFPRADLPNFGFFIPNPGNLAPPFLSLMTNALPDLGAAGISAVNFYPRWTYQTRTHDNGQLSLEAASDIDQEYRRLDTINPNVLTAYRAALGDDITTDDIFFYAYGLLHSPHYRSRFAADLKKMLPRIPTPATRDHFDAFTHAGRSLSDIHLGYETAQPYPLSEVFTGTLDQNEREALRVTKMRFKSKTDHSTLVYNSHLTLAGIPQDTHRYQLGSRSALEWIIERYQTKLDSRGSGIINDPNAWCDEHDDPRFIVDLIKRIVTVSVTTMSIIDDLPPPATSIGAP
ncbi:Putative DNA repair helicase RadD [Mycolicibacterium vanbaalenii]|uniref:DNA repair helicase RadD n=1 Tax=Mycolicibacterium vanbaalenii TaxID=110539 RepID=A0A5S9R4Q4_MYCVN|nr:DEAD/DEAH box helicase [Mycolicibacterium vanbaalenii]CAA0127318.1 Putative DNA repair helicase RadD [Mycolicibacterium vanbaalenii]